MDRDREECLRRKRSLAGFTPEELEAIRLADEEIEREFSFADASQRRESRELDRQARLAGMDAAARRIAAYQAAYYEAHREELRAKAREYYCARRRREKKAAKEAAESCSS